MGPEQSLKNRRRQECRERFASRARWSGISDRLAEVQERPGVGSNPTGRSAKPLREGMEAQGRIGRCGARSSARYGLRMERRPRSPGALPSVDRPVLIVGDTRFSSRPPLDEIIEVAVSLKACGAGGSRKRSAIRPSDETCEGINPMSAAGAEPFGQVTGKIRMTGSGTSTEKGGDA